MRILICVIGIVISFSVITSCKNEKSKEQEVAVNKISNNSVTIPVYDFKSFEPLLNEKDDAVHVINFWATWCKPCVVELPYFNKLHKEYENQGVQVTLVSLDFPDQIESRLIPFINKKNIKANVVFLDDPKSNDWIPLVDKDWSGALPATLIYTKDKRMFYEQSFEQEELVLEVEKFLNN